MPKEDNIAVVQGTIVEILPNVMYRVKLAINDSVILCYSCGKIKKARVRIFVGDLVEVEINSYNVEKGRLVRKIRK